MLICNLPAATGIVFKYLGITLRSDGGMNAEVYKMTPCGWNNWGKMPGVLWNNRIYVKRYILDVVDQPAMMYGMEAVPMAEFKVKQLEVTEMNMCR